jgi:hypothetical protein
MQIKVMAEAAQAVVVNPLVMTTADSSVNLN